MMHRYRSALGHSFTHALKGSIRRVITSINNTNPIHFRHRSFASIARTGTEKETHETRKIKKPLEYQTGLGEKVTKTDSENMLQKLY